MLLPRGKSPVSGLDRSGNLFVVSSGESTNDELSLIFGVLASGLVVAVFDAGGEITGTASSISAVIPLVSITR